MNSLEGKLAVISGASGGLGKVFAEALAERKCNLVLVARRQKELIELQNRLSKTNGVLISVIVLDLCLSGSPAQLYRTMKTTDRPVDILVNRPVSDRWGHF